MTARWNSSVERDVDGNGGTLIDSEEPDLVMIWGTVVLGEIKLIMEVKEKDVDQEKNENM